RIPFERSTLKDLPDFYFICPGSSGNSLSLKTSDDHQDDSPDMALDPVFQSYNATQYHSSRLLNYNDDDGDLSTYVPSASISIAQLMSNIRLPVVAATRLVAKLPALHVATKAMYALLIVIPSRQVDSFIDFDELLSVYNVPLLLRTFNISMLNDDFDDESYDSDDDSLFFFSSFDDFSFMSPLSEPIISLPITFSHFCFDLDPLVAISTIMFSDDIPEYKPFSISSFFDFSKFERHHKWKIYCSSLLPVVIFIS
ncbi:hypothetical protein RhiirC2_799501, partial [Rhizophagus irregularis]